jgi:hypothetical protein
MRKTLFVLVAFLINGGLAQADDQPDQSAELQALKARIATLEAALKAKTETPAPAKPAPVAPAVAPSYVSTLVHRQPVAYQCFLGDHPGVSSSDEGWVEILNRNPEYYLSLLVDKAPVVVMQPTGNGWEPLFPGRRDRTVLPPGSHCYFYAPARLSGRHVRDYTLDAAAYAQEMGSTDQAVVLKAEPSARLRTVTFHVASQRRTAVSIDPFELVE